MADQNFTISSGFYDAVSGDRTYSADDMNKPYKRLISNGVFATPAGEPSTDFQVLASSGMVINVSPGSGLFGNKWVENTAYIAITVPGNSSAYSRMDSVLVQVDLRQSGRVASIVYRTGTAASVPVAPAINETADVYEYRLANIQVPAAASSITQARITDARGTDECPWVTSLIKQVDTSALMLQWQAAYNAYFNEITNAFNAYIAEKQAAFDDFLEGLTEELSVATNVVVLRSEVCLTAESDQVQIGLPSYDPDTDVLDVYINGLYAAPGDKYTLSGDASYITLTAALAAGNIISFVVFKSVIGSDAASVTSAIQALNNRISAFTNDSGWQDLTLNNADYVFSEAEKPQYRKIGNKVTLRGCIKGTATGEIVTLPSGFRPSAPRVIATNALTASRCYAVALNITTGGVVTFATKGTATLTSSYKVPIDAEFYID